MPESYDLRDVIAFGYGDSTSLSPVTAEVFLGRVPHQLDRDVDGDALREYRSSWSSDREKRKLEVFGAMLEAGDVSRDD